MSRTPAFTAAAGALPILAVFLAWQVNLFHGFDPCNPFVDGCTSVSRAVRSGPGINWFKVFALPAAACMGLAWAGVGACLFERGSRGAPWVVGLGCLSAIAFVVYAFALGGDGAFYAWMRRYGVIAYFGGCGLAQLLVAARVAGRRRASTRVFLGVVGLTWLLGVLAAFKRRLVEDPQLQDRLQNALEWHFSTALSLGLLALAWCLFDRGGRKSEFP